MKAPSGWYPGKEISEKTDEVYSLVNKITPTSVS